MLHALVLNESRNSFMESWNSIESVEKAFHSSSIDITYHGQHDSMTWTIRKRQR
jgi:hypothetical protein